jgi:hypothetical protein
VGQGTLGSLLTIEGISVAFAYLWHSLLKYVITNFSVEIVCASSRCCYEFMFEIEAASGLFIPINSILKVYIHVL